MRLSRSFVETVLPLIVIVLLSTPAIAQEFGRHEDIEARGTSFRTFIRTGEPSIQVTLLSNTGSAIVEVGTELTLLDFLAVTGVVPEVRHSQEIRRVTVRIHRMEGQQRRVAFEERLTDIIERPDLAATLQERDVIEVEVRSRSPFGWRDGLSIVSAVSSTILLIDRLARIRQRF